MKSESVMKKIFCFFALAASVIASVSCQKEAGNDLSGVTFVLNATLSPDNKATIAEKSEDIYPILWDATDQIALVINGTTAISSSSTTVSQDGKSAQFTFVVDPQLASSATSYQFLSPAGSVEDAALVMQLEEQVLNDPSVIYLSSDEFQTTGLPESFGTVSFNALTSFARITLKDTGLTGKFAKLEFTAGGEKLIAGTSDKITLTDASKTLEADCTLLFPICDNGEMTLSDGFTVTVTDDSGESVSKTVTAGTLSFVPGTVSEFSVTFEKPAKGLRLDLTKFNLDDEFDKCLVQKVMNGDKQVAELDREFIKDVDADSRRTVIYPIGTDGKADLAKGIDIKTGGSLVWTKKSGTTADVAALGEGSGKVNIVYVNADGSLSLTTAATDFDDLTLAADILVDTRSSEVNSYRIVKIATQYWMAENLKTLRGFYGSTTYKMNYPADENFLGVGGYGYGEVDGKEDQTQVLYDAFVAEDYFGYGRMGSGTYKALTIEPEGWDVPVKDDFTKLKNNVNVNSDWGNRLKDELYEKTPKDISNISGFSAIGTGFYDSSLTWNTNYIYYWSKTEESMGSKADVLRFSKSSATGSITSINGDYGCYIRFIRK